MKTTSSLTYKIADEDWIFEAIHRLNYQTFVEEIPQHEPNPLRRLVDKFHHENTYLVCLRGHRLLGMVALRAKRPFSLDDKLANLDGYLPRARSLCEIRLLAVASDARTGVVCHGLVDALRDYCRRAGHDLGVISATVRQLKLYHHLGFKAFGPLVGSDGAIFQPMYAALEPVGSRRPPQSQSMSKIAKSSAVSFLPGPVAISNKVRRRFSQPPRSHRNESFVADFAVTRRRLCALVNANYVDILSGSGTLANDAVAAQLSLLSAPGLILANGEFGERLIDHGRRFRLSFDKYAIEWGEAFEPDELVAALVRNPQARWLWAVHCETSTGLLNDLAMLKQVCAARNLRLVMDCVSSIGGLPVDLEGVFLASSASGKALGAFPGLSMVFHENECVPAPSCLPRYLDLGEYARHDGIPFTLSSNLLDALSAALDWQSTYDFAKTAKLAAQLRTALRAMGCKIVADGRTLSPAVTTLALPATMSSRDLGQQLAAHGYLVSYMSDYLLKRNWLQICLMGEISDANVRALLQALRGALPERTPRKLKPTLRGTWPRANLTSQREAR